ncbi:MAG: hypothetical protein ACK47B_21305 [Armatimonadota bacterium]
MTRERLQQLEGKEWRLTRDGSTATAHRAWDDPLDPDSGWELLVLHTAGHGARLTLNTFESGLTERSLEDTRRLLAALEEAAELQEHWRGELSDDPGL